MDASTKKDIRLINIAGVLGTVYARLVLGEVLLFFVTQCLRIPKETWALVAALIPITSVVHLVSAYLTEHLRRRKVLSLTCFAVARLAAPALALLPFITGETDTSFRLYYLAGAIIAHNAISALGATCWLSWIADIVPEEETGKFWSIRLELTTLVNIAALLAGGWLIDYFTPTNRWGYLIIFGYAFIIGQLDIIVHARVPDRPMIDQAEKVSLRELLVAPWRHAPFRSVMLYRTVFVFGESVVGPFAFMYLIEELALSAWQVCSLTAVFLIFNALSFRLWRIIGERVGYRTICLVAGTMSGIGILYWWFLKQGNFLFCFTLLVVMRVYFGIVDAGIMLAHTTLTMNTAPERHRSTYFAQVTVIISAAMALGILFGRWLFLTLDPPGGVDFLGTRLTGAHILIGVLGLSRLLAIRVFYRHIPDAKAEVAMPRIARILRTNALRIFPALLSLERPLSPERRARHIDHMTRLIPGRQGLDLEDAVKTVLKDRIGAEEELYGIIGRERIRRGRGLERMVREIAESAAMHRPKARARDGAKRIRRLYEAEDLTACLRTVRRLAHQAAEEWGSPVARSALSVIDGLAETMESGAPPRDEAVLLAVYAYLQIVREEDVGKEQ